MYTTIIPATDWFFVTNNLSDETPLVWPLAAWGVKADVGHVIGLVSVLGGGKNAVMPGTCRLVSVPPLQGIYKHRADLSERESRAPHAGNNTGTKEGHP